MLVKKLLMLMLLTSIGSVYAKATTPSNTCSHFVHVNNPSGVLLKEKPNHHSRSVMKLHNMQYLCVIKTNDDWLKVAKVPLADKNQTMTCEGIGLEAGCTKMADFPTKWQIPKPKGQPCKTLVETNEYDLISKFSGVCATGWVRRQDIRFFAD